MQMSRICCSRRRTWGAPAMRSMQRACYSLSLESLRCFLGEKTPLLEGKGFGDITIIAGGAGGGVFGNDDVCLRPRTVTALGAAWMLAITMLLSSLPSRHVASLCDFEQYVNRWKYPRCQVALDRSVAL